MDQNKILSETVVKIENVKPEPDDDPAEAVFYFTERDKLSSLKREMKIEDEEEELKPLVGVFLDPEAVPSGEVKQPDEDPLALGTEIVRCKSETSAGGECVTAGDEQPVRARSLSESGHELGVEREEEGGNRQIQIQSSESSYQCSHCQKSFTFRSKLLAHMTTHSGERRHQCSVCQKSFKDKGGLDKHTRIHSGDRPHQCSVCQKRYAYSTHLAKHMRIHSGERPHQCPVCQKRYAYSTHLAKHMRIHSGERPHQCPVCQKRYAYSTHLAKHMRIHSGERPHQCPVCQKSYTWASSLINHKRIHNGKIKNT
ncbi:hypothetical protein R5R35_004666 [Gryllus longicercus]|uniref:C2H2-type domain-containing protein n=1 Tax=Gryllus longicercus TaxID=2509291 RepID=A0AAN9ZA39_9ORTH